ncbi:35814_t:CDS:2, partial [Gigaspora margarita]
DFIIMLDSQEGETEIECVYIEEKIRRKISQNECISSIGTGSSWPTALAVKRSSSTALPNLW